jgi:hypothetical protein
MIGSFGSKFAQGNRTADRLFCTESPYLIVDFLFPPD